MAGHVLTGPFVGIYCSQKKQTMVCYQGPYVEQMRGMLANAGDQYTSHQVAPAVQHTARRAYTHRMERRVTRKGACQNSTLFSGHRMGTCVCLNSRKCGRRHRAMQCAPPQHTCSAQVPRVCTPQNNTPHSVYVQHPVCWCRSQVRAVHPFAVNGRSCGQSLQTPATVDVVNESLHKGKQGVKNSQKGTFSRFGRNIEIPVWAGLAA